MSFNAFAVLNNSEDYSKFKTPEAIEKLKQHNLRLVQEELIGSINNADSFKVSNVFLAKHKGYVNGQLLSLKLIMEPEDDISTMLSEGVVINKLVYLPDLIHREEATPINQCYKCFHYGHETQYCTSPKAYCGQCAGAHNFRDCKSSYRKFILCKGCFLQMP